MTAPDPKTFLWDNLCTLMNVSAPSIDAVTRQTKIGRGTVQRIKEGNTSVGINVLRTIAERFKVEPWQLLAPSLCAGLFRLNQNLQAVPVTSIALPAPDTDTAVEAMPGHESVLNIKHRSTREEPGISLETRDKRGGRRRSDSPTTKKA